MAAHGGRKLIGKSGKLDNDFLGFTSLLSGMVEIIISMSGELTQPPVVETLMIVLGVVMLGYVISGICKKISSID
jgi:hypothetical protein